MPEGYFTYRCFVDGKEIQVPREVFDDQGFIKREYKGTVLENGVFVGECVFFHSLPCREDCLGPRQS